RELPVPAPRRLSRGPAALEDESLSRIAAPVHPGPRVRLPVHEPRRETPHGQLVEARAPRRLHAGVHEAGGRRPAQVIGTATAVVATLPAASVTLTKIL